MSDRLWFAFFASLLVAFVFVALDDSHLGNSYQPPQPISYERSEP